jgi:hypothetical protein
VTFSTFLVRRKREEGRRKKEKGRRKKEEGRRKKEEGRRKRKLIFPITDSHDP